MGDMRDMKFHWIEFMVGLWILLSPWTLGFSGITSARWSSVIAGVTIAGLSAWLLFGEGREMPGEK